MPGFLLGHIQITQGVYYNAEACMLRALIIGRRTKRLIATNTVKWCDWVKAWADNPSLSAKTIGRRPVEISTDVNAGLGLQAVHILPFE